MSKYKRNPLPSKDDTSPKKQQESPRFSYERPEKPKKSVTVTPPTSAPTPVARPQQHTAKDTSGLADYEKSVLSVIYDVMSVEEITNQLTKKTGLPTDTGALLSALTMLEIDGFLEALPGGSFRLIG